jgi:hypothetical protein
MTRYRFQEPKAWECHHAYVYWKVPLGGQTLPAAAVATAVHSVFPSGHMNADSKCEAAVIQFPKGKTMGRQTA